MVGAWEKSQCISLRVPSDISQIIFFSYFRQIGKNSVLLNNKHLITFKFFTMKKKNLKTSHALQLNSTTTNNKKKSHSNHVPLNHQSHFTNQHEQSHHDHHLSAGHDALEKVHSHHSIHPKSSHHGKSHS